MIYRSLLKYTLCINMVLHDINMEHFKYTIKLQVALKVYIVHKYGIYI